jgi:hypothetical protein
MDALFFFTIVVAIAEGLAQFAWLAAYFRFGIPILIAPLSGPVPKSRYTDISVEIKPFGDGDFLVRQRKYGLARYAFFHGVARALDPKSGDAGRMVLFIDWNAPMIGAFLSYALLSPSAYSVILGTATTILLAASIVYARRSRLCDDCLREIETTTQSAAIHSKV